MSRRKRIFDKGTREDIVWELHHQGKSITQISEIMCMRYDFVKEIILYGFRCQ